MQPVYAKSKHLNLKCNYCALQREDACSSNPLPGFQIGLTEDKLSLTTEQRKKLIDAWTAVEELNKQPQKFHQLIKTHWVTPTKRDDLI